MSTQFCKTYCRICEALCGLEVAVDKSNNKVIAIKPDMTHPVSKGFACIKGVAYQGLHTDRDRVNYPLKKVDGQFVRISWAQAIQEIGEKIQSTIKAHGPRSLGMYTGNPTFFNFKNILFSQDFLKSFGSPNLFASHSIDANNKFYVATKMYGRSMVHPVPDFEHMEFFMCLGSNPQASQMSIVNQPNIMAALQGIEERGGRVIIVDPRKTETAQKVGEYQFVRPGSDVYLLLAFLHVLIEELALDTADIEDAVIGLAQIRTTIKAWTPERCAQLCGIDAEVIREYAKAYVEADGAALYMSTGVNMGAFGSVCYWLVQVINLVSGNVDKKGGLLVPEGPFDVLKLAEFLGVGGEEPDRSTVTGWHKVAGCFPVNALAEEINSDHPERIRAMIVSAGNPLHSVPGDGLEAAFQRLDLCVVIDIYQNKTSQYADYILPATDMLERSDYPIAWSVLQPTPHAQYTKAAVKPQFERREEWEIFSDLMIAAKAKFLPLTLGTIISRTNQVMRAFRLSWRLKPDHILALLLRWGGKVSMAQLKRHPQGVSLPANEPGTFLRQRVPTKSKRVDLAPGALLDDLARVAQYESLFLSSQQEEAEDSLYIIGRRERKTHNSWLHNNPNIKHPTKNVAYINPKDAAARHIADGDLIKIEGNNQAIVVTAKVTENIGEGVISLPHGWGHRVAAQSKAHALAGADLNSILPSGSEYMEPLSGQAIMMTHKVRVTPAPTERSKVKSKPEVESDLMT